MTSVISLFGGDVRLGGSITSNLALLANYTPDKELKDLECVTLFRQHLHAVDLTARPRQTLRSNPTWPTIRLLPLDRLLLAIKVRKDPESGIVTHKPGSLDYWKVRLQANKDRTRSWIGPEHERMLHIQLVVAASYAFHAAHQESMKSDHVEPSVTLRYFNYAQASEIISSPYMKYLKWKQGSDRPTPSRMILITNIEGQNSTEFWPFNLQIA